MNYIIAATVIIVAIGFLWWFILRLRRWWVRPYSNPKALFYKLSRMQGLSRSQQRQIIKQLKTQMEANAPRKGGRLDYIQACQTILEASPSNG